MVQTASEHDLPRAAAYLAIPRDYSGDLRWSAAADVLEYADGGTFAFAAEVLRFLEGFAAQRPLVAFAHILHLIRLLRPRPETPPPGPPLALLRSAFRQSRRDFRNAGVFAALLCRDIPPAVDAPATETLWRWLLVRQAGAEDPPAGGGELPPLAAPAFEARVQRALAAYSFEDMRHWLSHGCGTMRDAGEQLVHIIEQRLPSLEGVLAEAAQCQRLCGAVPFVAQLVSALTLPPRRLTPPELPLGGYADVATRGHLEQVLPSQLAYDDLEFIRRLAQRELLFFRREDPHVRTREDLVVLLDQGVRTWGRVRLVLAAALFALGRLAQRRGLPFLAAASSMQGDLCDPLRMSAEEFGALLEASDLGPHPGLALQRVLEAPAEAARDVVLLTHPRNLAEADVAAAARTLRPGHRLFALAVEDKGDVQWAEVRRGIPVPLTRFHIDLDRAPPPAPRMEGQWRGDVEPVPYPFRFGIGPAHELSFAFDHAGEWLLVAMQEGMLVAVRTDDSRSEVLPRGRSDGRVATFVQDVVGVAGGFVVIARQPAWIAFHYNFASRTCKAHRFPDPPRDAVPPDWTVHHNPQGDLPTNLWYLRWAHTLVVRRGRGVECLNLVTGSRDLLPGVADMTEAVRPPVAGLGPMVWCSLPPQDHQPESGRRFLRPQLALAQNSGTVLLHGAVPAWETFRPLADGKPALSGAEVLDAVCHNHILAALFRHPPGNVYKLRLFRGPSGVPLAEFHQPLALRRFALSADGRRLARQVRSSQVEVRAVHSSGPPQALTPRGGFHHDAEVELGDSWLSLQIDKTIHLARWVLGRLEFSLGRGDLDTFLRCELALGGLGARGTRAAPEQVPAWLREMGGRFRAAAVGPLVAAVDRFSQVALFTPDGTLVCIFFAFRQQISAWMPDGTCLGPATLLGRPATPGAADNIGRALCEACRTGRRLV
jgi:hypothetical protein